MFIAKAASVLQSRLLGDRDQWTSAVMTWRRLQGELAQRRTTVNTPSTALGATTKREEGRRSEEEEKCSVESRKSTGGQIEESGNKRQRSGEQSGAQTLEKKRKRDDDEDDEEERRAAAQDHSGEKNVEKERTSEREGLSSCRKNGVMSGADFHTTPGLDHNVESGIRREDDTVKDAAVQSVKNGNNPFSFYFNF